MWSSHCDLSMKLTAFLIALSQNIETSNEVHLAKNFTNPYLKPSESLAVIESLGWISQSLGRQEDLQCTRNAHFYRIRVWSSDESSAPSSAARLIGQRTTSISHGILLRVMKWAAFYIVQQAIVMQSTAPLSADPRHSSFGSKVFALIFITLIALAIFNGVALLDADFKLNRTSSLHFNE